MSNEIPNVITLEAFEHIIKEIIAFIEEQNQFAEDMDKYLDGGSITIFGSPMIEGIVASLESCFAYGFNADGMISWWLWDAPAAGKNADSARIGDGDGTWYSLHTIPLLYEYLTTGKTSEIYQEANA